MECKPEKWTAVKCKFTSNQNHKNDETSEVIDSNNNQSESKEGKPDSRRRTGRCRRRPKKTEKKPQVELTLPRHVGMKNAVMMLNEMFPPPHAPQYKVISQSGPPNNPLFVMVCTLNEKSFTGEGKSKKDAKLACSQHALKELFGHDFSNPACVPEGQKPRTVREIEDWMELEGKNPISILNELYPGTQYMLMSSSGPSHSPEFVVRATLGNISMDGIGKSKKDAKLHASKALLVHLHKVGFNPITGDLLAGCVGAKKIESSQEVDHATAHTWADKVGKMVYAKFNEVFLQTTYSKRKVLAGIVMTWNGHSKVICISTGTKCINGENISLSGSSLNDSHAEIISRRCLLIWLYEELIKAGHNSEPSIFTPSQDGGFNLKAGISFDLFISTAPCGDARIFSLHEDIPEDTNLMPGPAGTCGQGNRGKLRSKVESGMGTVPLPSDENFVQTWDGVIAGERLLTMSCSDKILRWNILGFQGSLLCHWIQPLYFSAITIGSRFHPGHMTRAFYSRFDNNIKFPEGFYLNQPPILATTSPESRQVWKSSDCSVNWIVDQGPEVVNGSTGRTQSGQLSRLCKVAMANKFRQLLTTSKYKPRSNINQVTLQSVTYNKLKSMAVDYKECKEKMTESLKLSAAGKWTKKPVEQDLFYIWEGPRIPIYIAIIYIYGSKRLSVDILRPAQTIHELSLFY